MSRAHSFHPRLFSQKISLFSRLPSIFDNFRSQKFFRSLLTIHSDVLYHMTHMDLSSVLSIGGSAVSFFPFSSSTPSPSFHHSHFGQKSDANSTAEMHLFCKTTASKVRQRHEWQEKYGILGSPFKTSRARRGALFCRSGTWLEILGEAPENSIERETIRGSSTENTQYGILDFISVAIGLISIRGVQSNRFLCMNSEGSLYSTPISNYSSECIFMEEMMENYYNLYSSCAYGSRKRPWYVALRRTGIPRKGKNTRRRRKASHFLVIHYDRTSISQNYISEGQYGFSRRLLSNLRQQSLLKLRKKYQKNLKIPISSTNAQQLPTVPKGSNLNQKRKNRKKIKSRREERLLQEELRRQQRREDIRRLREEELKRNKERLYGEALHRPSHAVPSAVTLPSSASYPASLSRNPPPAYVPPKIPSGAVSTTPRLSGAGLQIRPRRISLTTTTTSAFSRIHNL